MSGRPIYLEAEDVIGLYADAFGCTEVQAADLLRDRPGLDAAVARPLTDAHDNQAAGRSPRPWHRGGQFSVDGNKRAALVAMGVFLLLSGVNVVGSQTDRANWILDLSQAGIGAEEKFDRLAGTLRGAARPD